MHTYIHVYNTYTYTHKDTYTHNVYYLIVWSNERAIMLTLYFRIVGKGEKQTKNSTHFFFAWKLISVLNQGKPEQITY